MKWISRIIVALLAFLVGISASFLFGCGRIQALVTRPTESSNTESIAPGTIPQVRSAAFLGKDHAWLVTWERYGQLWRTENGGDSWTMVSGKSVGGVFCGVSFIDTNRGWAGNFDGQIFSTNDGGLTWSFLSRPAGDDHHDSLICPQQISFIDEKHGWVIGPFSIWRTEDGGESWIRSLSMGKVDGALWQPTHVSFANQNVGLMSASGGIVHQTKDGGRTWQSLKLLPGSSDATDVLAVDDRIIWLTGFVSSTEMQPGTRLFRSDDGGENWHPVSIGDNQTYINSVCFVNENEGWAVGRVWNRPGDMRGLILHTVDRGESWREIQLNANDSHFERMTFPDSEHGWLIGSNNVYRTVDKGKSWRSVLKVTPMKVSID